MNPESPKTPREALEARLTALLLGELSADEAAAVRRALAQDAALTKLHDQLQATIGLVRETVATQAGPVAEQPPLKLSDDRREKLLAHFKTVPLLPKLASDQKAKRSWLIPMSVAAALVVLLGIAVSLLQPSLKQMGSELSGPEDAFALKRRTAVALSPGGQPPTETVTAATPPTQVYDSNYGLPMVAITGGGAGNSPQVHSLNVVGYYNVTVPKASGESAERLQSPGTPLATPAVTTPAHEAARSDPSAPAAAGAFVPATPPPEPAPPRRSSSIVLPSLDHSSDGGNLAETKIPIADQEGARVLERPAKAQSQENRSLGRYAYEVKPTSDDSLTAAKPDSWYFDNDGKSQSDFSVRQEGRSPALWDDNSAIRGFYSVSDSQDLFAKEAGANRSQAGQIQDLAAKGRVEVIVGQTAKGLPTQAGAGVVAPAGVAHDGFYGGYAVNAPTPAAGAIIAIPDPGPASFDTPGKAAADKTFTLGDTPELGRQFYRLAEGGGGGVGGAQIQPPRPSASPAPQAGSGVAGAATAATKRVELVPFAPQLPAPTLKGTPEDLPKGPNLEPLGTKPDGTVVLGRPEAASASPDPELYAAFRRRYGVASADKPLAENVAKQPVSAAKAPAVVGTMPNSSVAAVESPALGEAKESPSKADRGITPLASARSGNEPTLSAGNLNLQWADKHLQKQGGVSLTESDRKQVAELRERYLANGREPTEGGRIAPAEEVHSTDVDALTVTTATGKDVVGGAVKEAIRVPQPAILLPSTDTGITLGVEHAKTEESARAKIAPERRAGGGAKAEPAASRSAKPTQGSSINYEVATLAKLKEVSQQIWTDYDSDGFPDAFGTVKKLVPTQASSASDIDAPPVRKASTNAPIAQPEVQTSDNAFSTFSLNVSDVAFKLAAASLEKGQMPDAASVRAEEFINAFDYRDPEAPPGVPIAFAWERARYPFAHNHDLLRFSLKTAAAGRQAGRPLNLVLLLDNSGSMERADRVQIIREALRVLAGQLQPQDKLSVITFARTPRLWVDGVAGDKSGEVLEQVSGLTPQGGTNLEEAMNLAYATALRHYLSDGINRVVLLTDGAANLGNVEPEPLKQKVEAHRQQGIALDCFGIGWEGFNDDLLEVLSRNGDGRYGFINSPEDAATEFAGQLAGALKVAASDVKVQVEFNPKRVTAYRQIGYAKHQLTKEQFRDNTVDAAEIAAQEAGNALYTVEVNPAGEGPLCIVRCRFKIPGTTDYREHEWAVPYTGNAVSLEQASPAMRLAASASAFAEWLVVSPFAAEVTPDALLGYLNGVSETYGADARPKKLEWMIRQAKSIGGK